MKDRAKMTAWVLLVVGTLAVPGLLRLHDGQIQEQQPDGSWRCADQKIREIVQRDGQESIGIDLTDGAVTIDPNDWLAISTRMTIADEFVYDPNTCTVPDSFIRSLCEKGRVCKTMGHIWKHKWTWDRGGFEICQFCGADRYQIWIENQVKSD